MRTIIIAAIFLSLFSGITFAQKTVYDSLDNSLLWKISGKKLTEPIYLYGTIHAICTESVYWPSSIDSLVKNSSKIIFEIDVQQMDSKYYDASLNNFITSTKPNITYSDNKLVNPNLNGAKLLNQVKKIHQSSVNADDSSEALLNTDLYTYSDLECKEILSYEKIIYSKVKKSDIEVSGLETIFKQYWTLAQINNLAKKQNSYNNTTPLSYVVDLYILQQINKMHNTIYEKQKVKAINELLFDNRNKKWVKKLKSELQNTPTFIAVGVGHLTGSKGLIHLLRTEGYTLTPVTF